MEINSNIKKKIVIKSEDERLVFGEVYIPLHVDTDHEAMTAEEIKKMAHSFLSFGNVNKIDTNHNYIENGCVIAESFIARKNDPDSFIEGSWVLGVYVLPDDLWEGIKKGDLNGFSFGGEAQCVSVNAIVKVARKMKGETENSFSNSVIPLHSHKVNLCFDDNGIIINGKTEEAMGHIHTISKSSATNQFLDHNHRLILVNNNG